MTNILRDLLLIESFNLNSLIEEYRLFFLSLLPSAFILAVIIEYFDRLEPFALLKRALLSILILTTVTSVYERSISSSIEAADQVFIKQKQQNILLMDLFDGFKHWDSLSRSKQNSFFKDKNGLTGALGFLKYHLFDSFINDGFTITIYFITQLCFLIIKVVYSLVYYLGYGLIGIPCLIYLFPSMGNVLRGSILSYLWCLIIPHILVFIISMIGTEINKGHISGQVIGGSVMGTAFLFILTLFIAFSPLIGAMILNGSGISQAGGVIASIGANYVMNLPKNTINNAAMIATGRSLGPKMAFGKNMAKDGYKIARNAKNSAFNKLSSNKDNTKYPNINSKGIGNTALNNNGFTGNSEFKSSFNQNVQKTSGTELMKSQKKINTQKPYREADALNLSQNTKRSPINGAVQKHSEIHRAHKKTSYIHRSGNHISSHYDSRNRNNNKPSQGK